MLGCLLLSKAGKRLANNTKIPHTQILPLCSPYTHRSVLGESGTRENCKMKLKTFKACVILTAHKLGQCTQQKHPHCVHNANTVGKPCVPNTPSISHQYIVHNLSTPAHPAYLEHSMFITPLTIYTPSQRTQPKPNVYTWCTYCIQRHQHYVYLQPYNVHNPNTLCIHGAHNVQNPI